MRWSYGVGSGIVGKAQMILPAYIIDELLRKERELRRREELRIENWDPELCPLEESLPETEPHGNIEVDFVLD
ncbi:MAG: hypothetical protein MUC50_03370 [Myxococcota bacterium]|nr:hypothetical protein [Myxococcota bacterium]